MSDEPAAVEVEAQLDARLAGLPLQIVAVRLVMTASLPGRAGTPQSACRARRAPSRNAVVSASVPAVTRRWFGMPTSRMRMPRSSSASNDGVRVVARRRRARSCFRCGAAGSRGAASSRDQPVALRADLADHREHLGGVGERCEGRRLRERGQVVREPDEAERVGHGRVGGEVADARAGEREGLAHGARDEQPRSRPGRSVRAEGSPVRHELGVGLVDDHDAARGVVDRLDRLERQRRAGRVVRGAQDHDVGVELRRICDDGRLGARARSRRPGGRAARRCRCRRRAAGTSSRSARIRGDVRPGPPNACRMCCSTSFDPFAAQMSSAVQTVAQVAREALPQLGEFAVRVAVDARRSARRRAATMSAATSSGTGCVFSFTFSATGTTFCGAPYGVLPRRSSRMGRSEREVTAQCVVSGGTALRPACHRATARSVRVLRTGSRCAAPG